VRQRPGFLSRSWLSWEGPIEYRNWLQEPRHPLAEQECIFSLVNRNSYDEVLDDAAMLRSSALVIFDSIAPGTSNAILRLTTTVARFRISQIMHLTVRNLERTIGGYFLIKVGKKFLKKVIFVMTIMIKSAVNISLHFTCTLLPQLD
jgi:hypothetical protein